MKDFAPLQRHLARFYFKRLLAEILAIENLENFSSFSEDFRH
jgi:hypothetical protein